MKGFQEGNKLAGSRKGIKNKKTQQWEVFEEFMMNRGLERFEQEIQALEGKDFVDKVIQMMEYFKPKLARTEVKEKIDQNITIKWES